MDNRIRRIGGFLLALLLLVLPLGASADQSIAITGGENRGGLSKSALEEEVDVKLTCASAILVEPRSGQIIFEKNADEKRAVASVTKTMTILLALEALEQGRVKLSDEVLISKEAAGMGGSQVLLDVNESQSFEVLLKSMIVASANDASVAVAEHLYGSEAAFVKKMNERAQALGMADTAFQNCTGLPVQGQETTARDIARMTIAMLEHQAYFDFSTIWMDELDHGDGRITSLTNTNRLIRTYDGCDGGKTGSTKEAGYCMTATAKRGDMRLIAVVLGAETGKERFSIASKMMDYGFANYRTYTVADRGARVRGEMRVVGGSAHSVPLMLDSDLSLLLQKGGEGDVTLKPNLPGEIYAPFEVGEYVGSVDVLINDRLIAQIPVVTAEAVNRQGFFNGFERVIQRWFYQ